MSIRRTQQTVENLWRALEMRDLDQTMSQRHDLEVGPVQTEYKGKACKHDPSMNAPRLHGQGCCSKLVLLMFCSMSCTVVAIGVIALVNLPIVVETRTVLHQRFIRDPVGDASGGGGGGGGGGASPRRKPLPDILRQFSTIKRASAPERGADRSTVDDAFPHWREGTQVALGDVALALSAIVEQIEQIEQSAEPR